MKYLPLGFLVLLGLFGVGVELNPNAQSWQLLLGFHLAALSALTVVSLRALKQFPRVSQLFWFLGLQLIAYRIAYFPIVVFAATVSCYTELGLHNFVYTLPIKIFPAMFVSAALFFALISGVVWEALKGRRAFIALLIVLGIPAVLISFANQQDLTVLADNNGPSIEPLPRVTLPQVNPYGSALEADNSVGQKMMGLAGYLLYDSIPNVPWSKAVQGTLEQSYLKHPEGNAHEQLTAHYAAFLAAHRQLLQEVR